MSNIAARVGLECDAAFGRYGDFTSAHEGFGVLAEEVSELLAAIHKGCLSDVESEAIQVSAVAMRLAQCCSQNSFIARSSLK